MSFSIPFGLYLGLVGLAGGAAVLFVQGIRADRHPWHHLMAFLVPAVTALSYIAMLFGQGVTVLPTGRVYYWARWADAAFGATVLVLNTALIALPRSSSRRGALLAGLAAANVITMVAGLFAGFSTGPAAQWTWYFVGSGAYTAVLWMLFVRVPMQAQRQGGSSRRRRTFWTLALLLIGVAMLYPVWWIATPLGMGLVDVSTALLVFAVLDVLSKALYGMILVRVVRRIPEDERETSSANRQGRR
ncbi:bacteriorhodopsin [Salinibacter ruber]|uniref:Bacteriorhodopsin n=1 Tax=Salinibacter ruber TaxID=146919 RepID=A0AAW5PBW2_9BACT|nr:bacteriorhodopsin [Salinibacter ruber]MCS3665658.1 bacteriorhodopsin [Salinibacter ruber]MCS4159359.1 bacteriorhodopsin [Salinibacter ruber]MCS4223825.1 bacteriorhodopsin [Salinibacter ruber]